MPRIVIFDELASPQRVTGMTGPSSPLKPYEARTDVIVDPDLSLLVTLDGNHEITSFIVPRRDWKHEAGSIVTMTGAEITARDAAQAAAQDLAVRDGAKDGLLGFDNGALLMRAFADIVKDELNILRSLHSLPDRTLTQLRTAINSRVDGGSVDS